MRALTSIVAATLMLVAWGWPAAHAAAPTCIGLVLGGGGARGAAHIGVLKVLERERVPICKIAGTSMGSIVGGFYAAGYTPKEIEAILASVNWQDVLDDDPPRDDFPMRRKNDTLRYLLDFRLGFRDGAIQLPRGVIQGQKLLLLLRRLTLHTWQVPDFDHLPIPFRAVATDIARGEPVIFDHGDLALAIRASMSVPAAFAPIRVDGRLLVDGGIVNNVPVDIAKAMGADRLIVVDVGAPLADESALNSPIAITMQMLDVLMKQRTQQVLSNMSPEDIKILPQLGDIGSAEFDRAMQAVPLGAEAAEAMVARLREWSLPPAAYADYVAHQRRLPMDAPTIAFLEVVKTRSRTPGYVERELTDVVDRPLDVARVERAIGGVYGLGNYERIVWNPIERDGQTGLQVTPVDKGWGPNFVTFGLQLTDDFEGRNSYQLGVEYTMTGLNRYGGEWRSRVEIGRVAGLRTEFFQPAGERGQYFAYPYLEYTAQDQTLRIGPQLSSEYRLRRANIGFDVGLDIGTHTQLYAGVQRAQASATLQVGDDAVFQNVKEQLGAVRAGYVRDTLDHADFPGRGSRGEFRVIAQSPALGSAFSGQIVDLAWDKALTRGKQRFLLGTRLHSIWGDPGLFDSLSPLGGFGNLSGYADRELLGGHSALFRSVWYQRLGEEGKLFSTPAYFGATLEAGNVYGTRERLLSLENLIYAGSLFVALDSPFGPIFLSYGRADTGASSVYLNFGGLLRPPP